MRTKSAAVAAILANATHSVIVSVALYTRGGTLVTTFNEDVMSIETSESVDSLSSCVVKMRRQYGEQNLGPVAGGFFIPGERVVVKAKVVPSDMDYGTEIDLFDGQVDSVSFGDDEMDVTLTGRGEAWARDAWIEEELVYGFCQGTYATGGCYVWSKSLSAVGALSVGDLVIPSEAKRNGHFYRVTTAGTAGSSEPAWPTSGTVADGTITWTESGSTSDTAGVPIEDLLQQLLDDNGLGAFTLSVSGTPSWSVKPYRQGRNSVWSAMKTAVDQFGWTLRWDYVSSAFVLHLSEPQRTGGSSVRTFALDEQRELRNAGQDCFGIRNAVRIIYSDSSDRDSDGVARRKSYETSDSTSIAAYGRRFIEASEGDTSQIDSASEAAVMGAAILSDLKDPDMGVTYVTGIDPYLQLGDIVTLPADDQHWTSDQPLGIVAITHSVSASGASTTLQLDGKPVGQKMGWHRKDARGRQSTSDQSSLVISSSFELTATPAVGGTKLTVSPGNALKDSTPRAFEIHVGTSTGFTPSSSTVRHSGVSTSAVISDLVPGQTYYAVAIPYTTTSDGRRVLGEPSAEVSFTATQTKSLYYDTSASMLHMPINGNFEHATQDLTAYPPDKWSMESGMTWGSSGNAYYSIDTDGSVNITLSSTPNSIIASDPFEVRRGCDQANIYVRAKTSDAFTTYLTVNVLAYSDAALTNYLGGISYNTAALTSSFDRYDYVWKSIGQPDANFFVVKIGLAGIAVTHTAVVADIYIQEAEHESLKITQDTWTSVSFNTGWGNLGSGWQTAQYMKDSMGFVHLRGSVLRSSGSDPTILTLPTGYRPSAGRRFPANGDGPTYAAVDVYSDGSVDVVAGSVSSHLSLDGISFDTR